jgi:hypothetical protein
LGGLLRLLKPPLLAAQARQICQPVVDLSLLSGVRFDLFVERLQPLLGGAVDAAQRLDFFFPLLKHLSAVLVRQRLAAGRADRISECAQPLDLILALLGVGFTALLLGAQAADLIAERNARLLQGGAFALKRFKLLDSSRDLVKAPLVGGLRLLRQLLVERLTADQLFLELGSGLFDLSLQLALPLLQRAQLLQNSVERLVLLLSLHETRVAGADLGGLVEDGAVRGDLIAALLSLLHLIGDVRGEAFYAALPLADLLLSRLVGGLSAFEGLLGRFEGVKLGLRCAALGLGLGQRRALLRLLLQLFEDLLAAPLEVANLLDQDGALGFGVLLVALPRLDAEDVRKELFALGRPHHGESVGLALLQIRRVDEGVVGQAQHLLDLFVRLADAPAAAE